jgi:hypothetical protein
MSLWDNSSFLLSQPKNGCNRQVALHLPIVRKNWLESIVLKQKSIAFGSCPRKFNELIFKVPFSLEFNSVTPGAHHTDLQVGSHTAPAFLEPLPAPCEGPEDLIRKPSRLESPPTTDPPTFRGAKRHSTGFQGGEKLMPLLPVRMKSLLDFLISSKEIRPLCPSPVWTVRRLGSRGSLGW